MPTDIEDYFQRRVRRQKRTRIAKTWGLGVMAAIVILELVALVYWVTR